jgi:ketosteroid isomerase-like protein
MSNADLIRQMWDAFERRDTEAARTILHPDIVWDATRLEMPDGAEVYRGYDGVAEFWRRWLGAWETLNIPEPEVIEAGDKVFVWVEGQVNRGRTSGIEVEQPPFGFVWTFEEGRAVRMELHADRDDALTAAGLD